MDGKSLVVCVSACLLGKAVRYDNESKLDPFLKNTWGVKTRLLPICPEVEAGLPVPREPMALSLDEKGLRATGRTTGADYTELLSRWSRERAAALEAEKPAAFILKSRSPSCYGDADPEGTVLTGFFRRALEEKFPFTPAIDEKTFHDPDERALFVDRIFLLGRWRECLANPPSRKALIDFHTRNKLQLLAHSPVHYRTMGRIVANPEGTPIEERFESYGNELLGLLKHKASRGRVKNVLSHVVGYFRKTIPPEDRAELNRLIDAFAAGEASFVAPLTLASHFAKKTGSRFLDVQTFLSPELSYLQLKG